MAGTPPPPVSLSPVIVTGGCGFIGYHLVEGLLVTEPECIIHVIDINTARNRVDGVEYHTVDIVSAAEVERVFATVKPKTVFHVACPDSVVPQPQVFKRVIVDGGCNVLSAAKKTAHAFVNTSTSSVIHDNLSHLVDADETFPILKYPQQKRVYSLRKAEIEALILAENRKDGDSSMLTVSMWPASGFGPRDGVCMGKIVEYARKGNAKYQIGPGGNMYSFIYVENLVHGHILAAQALIHAFGKPPPSDKNMRVDGECFNLTNDESVDFWEFQRAMSASVGLAVNPKDVKIVPKWLALLAAGISEWALWLFTFGKKQPLVTRESIHLTTINRTMNGDKAKKVLGYQPKVSLQEGLTISGKWFSEQYEHTRGRKEI